MQGFFHGVRTIIAKEGIAGTYKGITPTIMKQGSNQAIRYVIMVFKERRNITSNEKQKSQYRTDTMICLFTPEQIL